MQEVLQDVRYSFRAWRKGRGILLMIILLLALGIGANSAVFSLIDVVLLKFLPVQHPEELLHVTSDPQLYFSNPAWEQLRDRQDVFSGILAYGRVSVDLRRSGEKRTVRGQYVSGGYFATLGVRPELGRVLTLADDKRGCPAIATLSYDFWTAEYDRKKSILGESITIDGHPFEIVGVSQSGFAGLEVGSPADVFLPLCSNAIVDGESNLLNANYARDWGWLQVIGRPQSGLAGGQVEARLRMLAPEVFQASTVANWRAEDRKAYLRHTLDTESAWNGLSSLRRQYRQPLLVLMGIVGIVLFAACVNVAILLLGRGVMREREIAIHAALGCKPVRLFRQMLTESLLLSGSGAVLGLFFAWSAARLLVDLLDLNVRPTLDYRVLVFTAAISVLTALIFGSIPAWRSTRVEPNVILKAQGPASINVAGFEFDKILIAVQLALSLVLVVGACLLLSTFWRLAEIDKGLNPSQVLVTTIDVGRLDKTHNRHSIVFREILEQVRAIHAVRSASMSNIIPLCGCRGTVDVVIEGSKTMAREGVTVLFQKVSDGYFETVGTPLLSGRDFDIHDTPESPKVAVVSQSMARKYYGNASPVGQSARIQEGTLIGDPYKIIGVVKDAKYGTLREEMAPTLYLSGNQDLAATPMTIRYLETRVTGSPRALTGSIKRVISNISPDISFEFTTLSARVSKLLQRERLLAVLSGAFGGVALLLSIIGVYGVISHRLASRRREIGIRIAVGAGRASILRMVFREVTMLVAIGLGVGIPLSLVVTRFLASLLYGLRPDDLRMLEIGTAILATVALLAGWVPSLQASCVDPVVTLREE